MFELCCEYLPVSCKDFLEIQPTIECGLTLKRVLEMIKNIRSDAPYK